MELRKKIGGIFMVGFDGEAPPAGLANLLNKYAVGGVILYKRNIRSHEQLKTLIKEIREIAGRHVLVAVDHEGGRVFRMPPPFTQWPPMAEIGRQIRETGDENLAYRIGRKMAEELKEVGVDINFAPVLDVNTNIKNPVIGDRSFGSDELLVARAGIQLIRGLQDHGIVACGKHFPGHGDTSLDSHFDLPILPHTPKRLKEIELVPFVAAVEAGVRSIMTAHVIYEGLDREYPATLSKTMIKGILLNDLCFKGAVFTDDLMMKAIINKWTLPKACHMALNAGCHVLLVCSDGHAQESAIEYLCRQVNEGHLSEALIDAAAHRIRELLI